MTDSMAPLFMIAVILVLATHADIKEHKIPNVLSIGGIFIGICMMSYFEGFTGFLNSLKGMGVGFFLFMPFYILKGMAAGDVKLMAAVGAFLGPEITLACVAFSLLSGTVLAIIYIVAKGSTQLTMSRYLQMAKVYGYTHQFVYLKPTEKDVGSDRFPYASAIMVGTLLGLLWVA